MYLLIIITVFIVKSRGIYQGPGSVGLHVAPVKLRVAGSGGAVQHGVKLPDRALNGTSQYLLSVVLKHPSGIMF